MTNKQRLKLELYNVLLNTDLEKLTDNEATLIHHLAIDDETMNALEKRARRDYREMVRRANHLIPDARKLVRRKQAICPGEIGRLHRQPYRFKRNVGTGA